MKTIIAILTVMILSFPTLAMENTKQDHEFCRGIAKHAEFVMKARQDGVPAVDLYKGYEETKQYFTKPDAAMNMFDILIREAYEEPRFASRTYIEKAVVEFQNKMYLECLKGKRRI